MVRLVGILKPDLIPDSVPPGDRPVQDEWGIYDPEQAGFEAVLRKLGPENDETPPSDSGEPSDK